MKGLLILPLILLPIIGFVDQFVDIADDSINKTITFVENSNRALDCAFQGVEISLCSPDLMDISVKKEFTDLEESLKELNNRISIYVSNNN